MNEFRQYIFAIIISAFACSLCSMITENNSANRVIKLLTGLIMTATVLYPVKQIPVMDIREAYDNFKASSDVWISEGLDMADTAKTEIIKQEVTTYILDKAEQLDSDLSVELVLDERFLPETVVLRGNASPYVKMQISELLVKELGIAKENQIWSG